MALINKIKKTDTDINDALTGAILLKLLDKKQKGIRLPMASTILHFKNPKIYQIIDQRVYRFICKKELKYSLSNLNEQINIYLSYLDKLREVCERLNLDFEHADRLFYATDKKYNSGIKLNGY
jgi:thermostable 8-oxoguanine DNA glycosylase